MVISKMFTLPIKVCKIHILTILSYVFMWNKVQMKWYVVFNLIIHVVRLCFYGESLVFIYVSFQARGPKKHLKRLNAPKAWMLDKLGGVYAPRPSTGPHKLRECLPLVIFLRNRLKYALTGNEVLKIVKQRLIKVDGKVRTDPTYPAGFMGKMFLFYLKSYNVNNQPVNVFFYYFSN